MPITHKFISEKPDSQDTSLVRPSNWNEEHKIDHGIAILDADGVAIVNDANTPAIDRILLIVQIGNSNMKIYVSSVIEGVSFTITATGEQDDAGLSIPWFFL
jgi:flagellar capping protein FliD